MDAFFALIYNLTMNFIFDLDGTLLDTLEDIKDALNDALNEIGVPYSYTYEEAKKLIGNGVDILMHRALKDLDDPLHFEALKKAYLPRYLSYQGRKTKPFPNVVETLQTLQERGDLLFIASNKPNLMAQDIVQRTLPMVRFSFVAGHKDGDPVKPNPIQVERILRDFHLDRAETIFVGDSYVDVLTAKNASLPICLCLYGYGVYDETLCTQADRLLKNLSGVTQVSSIQNGKPL